MLARFASALAALAFGFLLLAGLEASLRVLGVGEQIPRSDPFSGFSREIPMFEPAERDDGAAYGRPRRAGALTRELPQASPLELAQP